MSQEEKLASIAKSLFAENLRTLEEYSTVSEKSKPYADITATRKEDGLEVYFEIKASLDNASIDKSKDKYFGAATLSEWNLAIKIPDRYYFVFIVVSEDKKSIKACDWYKPEELLSYSTIPPFKINFNLPYVKNQIVNNKTRRKGTVHAYNGVDKKDYGVIEQLTHIYEILGGSLKIPDSMCGESSL